MSLTPSMVSTTSIRASAHALSFSSVSLNSSPFGGNLHVDRHGFLMSSHRVGGPVLCSFPTFTSDTPTQNSVEIHWIARRVIKDLKIEPLEVVIRGRLSKIDPEPKPIPTVLILMPDHPQPDLWYRAARLIYHELQKRSLNFSVELIEEKLYDGIYYFPVEESHAIYSKWKAIAAKILGDSFINEWTGLSCWRYGTNRARHLNPVTVIVTVRKNSTGSFTNATQLIRGILAHFHQSDVDILFIKDEKRLLSRDPPLHPDFSDGAIYPGVSIGRHSSKAGTLGGMIQLRFHNESGWHTYGLTCFHCIWPSGRKHAREALATEGAKKALSEWQYEPLKLANPPSNIARQILKVDHPSLRDLSKWITKMSDEIRGYKSEEFLQLEKIKQAIDRGEDEYMSESALDKYNGKASVIRDFEALRQPFIEMRDNKTFHLGHVVAGSGMNRTRVNDAKEEISLDWALIDVAPGRLQPQMHGDRFEGNRPFHHGIWGVPLPPKFLFNPQLDAIHNMAKLYKSGRSTKITSGLYSGLEVVELVEKKTENGIEIVPIWEHHVATTTISEAFAEPGDSGAWVFTEDNEVFGVVKSGYERRDTISISRIVDIFEDIKVLTGAEEIRIAPGSAP